MARKLQVEIIGDASSLQRALQLSGAGASTLGSRLGTLAKTASLVAGGAALGGIAATLKVGYGEWSQHAKVAAQTSAVLKSTGSAANVTAGQVDALAGSLLRKSGVDDEAIQSGENMLLTFKNVRNESGKGNDIFNQTTKTLLDMTTAMTHGNVTSEALSKQAIQLGKAMNDPVKGMSALRRVGVTFTEDQQKQVAAMVKSGNTMGAQKLVLKELNSEFGGSAEAMGKTLPGQISILKESFNNLAGDIFGKLVPSLQTAVTWTTQHWPQISAVVNAVFDAIGSAITFVAPYIGQFIALARQAVEYVQGHWTQISAVVAQVMAAVKSAITDVVFTVKAIWAQFGEALLTILRREFDSIVSVIRNTFNVIVGIFQLVGDLIHGRWGQVWADLKKIVSNALSAAVTIIRTEVANVVTVAVALGTAIVQGVVKGLAALGGLVTSKLAALARAVTGAGEAAVSAAVGIGVAIVQGVISGIGSVAGALVQKLKDTVMAPVHAVKGALGIHSPSQLMHDEVGRPMAEGVIEGWIAGSASLPNKMASSTKAAIDAARRVVASSKASFENAFSSLSSTANTLFSGISSAALGSAGKELAKLTAAHDAAGIAQNVQDARDALSAAQAGGDPAAILSAQQQLNDALYQQQVAALQIRAAEEQKQLDASNAVKQIAFDKALDQLEKHLAKGHTSTKTAMKEIEALLRKYGVTFGEVGQDMGTAWVQGLKDAITSAARHGGSLKSVLQDQADSIKVPHLATGGYIAQSGIAVVHKGEHVVPAGGSLAGSGGGNTYNLTVHALDPSSSATAVVEAITFWERANGPRYARA